MYHSVEAIVAHLAKCKVCNHDVSTGAKVCPHCGHSLKTGCLGVLFRIVAILFLILVLIAVLAPPVEKNGAPIHSQGNPADQGAAVDVPQGSIVSARPRSDQQKSFDAAILEGQQAERLATSDIEKGAALATRERQICSVLARSKVVRDWYGIVEDISANSDGKGIVVISPLSGVTIGTWNNAFSDVMHETLIDPKSSIFSTALTLKKGDSVRFSGTFFSDQDHCITTSNLTLTGKLSGPDFIFRFSELAVD